MMQLKTKLNQQKSYAHSSRILRAFDGISALRNTNAAEVPAASIAFQSAYETIMRQLQK